jgi:hypothetical protein
VIIENDMKIPRVKGMPVSNDDYTQVILHNLENVGFRRDRPYMPPIKPIKSDKPAILIEPSKTRKLFDIDTSITVSNKSEKKKRVLRPGALSEAFVMQIVEMLHSNFSYPEIARKMGVTLETVSRIRRKKTNVAFNCWAKIYAQAEKEA